jgi:hypothetical protein
MAIARNAPNWTQIEQRVVNDEMLCFRYPTVKHCIDCDPVAEAKRMSKLVNRTDICPLNLKKAEAIDITIGRLDPKTLKWTTAFYRPFAYVYLGPISSLAIENVTSSSNAANYATANMTKANSVMTGLQAASQLAYALGAATFNKGRRGICKEFEEQGYALNENRAEKMKCSDYDGWLREKCLTVRKLCTDVFVQTNCLYVSPTFSGLSFLMLATMIVDSSRVCACLGEHQTPVELRANLEFRRRRFLVASQIFGLIAILTGIPTWHTWLGGVHQSYLESYAILAINNAQPPYEISVGQGYWLAVGGWILAVAGQACSANLLHAPKSDEEVGSHKLQHTIH